MVREFSNKELSLAPQQRLKNFTQSAAPQKCSRAQRSPLERREPHSIEWHKDPEEDWAYTKGFD